MNLAKQNPYLGIDLKLIDVNAESDFVDRISDSFLQPLTYLSWSIAILFWIPNISLYVTVEVV